MANQFRVTDRRPGAYTVAFGAGILTAAAPMIPLGLFRRRSFSAAVAAQFLMAALFSRRRS
jgi:hypothetical protein